MTGTRRGETLNIVWFWALAAMLTTYGTLDGYDLGVGSLHLWIARGDTERRIDGGFISQSVRIGIQRLLSGSDRGAVAAGLARGFHRIPQSDRQLALESPLGCVVLVGQLAAGVSIGGCAWKRGARLAGGR